MRTTATTALAIILLCATTVRAQETAPASSDKLDAAAADIQRKLEESLAELSALRERLAEEKIPLADQLNRLESELTAVREEYQQTSRLLDTRTLDLSNLTNEIKSREAESTYLSNLLGEYVRNFESRLHIAELHRYDEPLDAARGAPDNSNLSIREIYEAQTRLLAASIDRLDDALGGTRFDGAAVDEEGRVKPGTFALLGPAALFRSADGKDVGTAEQRIGSLEPSAVAFGREEDAVAAAQLITLGEGMFPFDPTLGNAHKIEATEETFVEHVEKGGPVMVPIFALAGAAFLVALFKWIGLSFVRRPSPKKIRTLLRAVARGDRHTALERATAMGGPAGQMLIAGVEHLDQPRELIEEVMYETVLTTRLRLQRFLPFIAISAAAAPLLGLLGTVTGIINTFKLITVFGSGDVKTLSGGISEALITTEFGLIVAIPSLLLHAFLARKARGVIDGMEQTAIAFVNEVAKTRSESHEPDVAPPAPRTRQDSPAGTETSMEVQVRDALANLLAPAVRDRPTGTPAASPPSSSTPTPAYEPETVAQDA